MWNEAFRDWSISRFRQNPRFLRIVVEAAYVQVSALWNTFRLEDRNESESETGRLESSLGAALCPAELVSARGQQCAVSLAKSLQTKNKSITIPELDIVVLLFFAFKYQ